ncbi:transposase [Variovorax paradoxus]|uniref:Transposase n=1 Tax=Variovorax paradoxus TaxID=34073 RepID=A0A5Q0LXB9_VARPD|nr:transposase [Variovorax paradoxus]QFZ81923.1 transposase [Variovorax paradoxus]
MDTSVLEPAGRRRRRKHSAEFKAELIRACQQPGVSSAAIALANGLNANMLRRWVNCAEQPEPAAASVRPLPPPAPEFVPLKLPAPQPQTDIRIELQRGGVSVSVIWPVSAAADCATWVRAVLR